MSYFYTSVNRRGNNILVKYIKGGERFQNKIPFKPELYIADPASDSTTRCYKGERIIDRMEFDTMREANDFMQRYEGIHGVSLHGMEDYVLQFINRAFRNKDMEIDYDESQIRLCWFDIEVSSYVDGVDNGFPEPGPAMFPITCIGLFDVVGGKYHLFTTGYVSEEKIQQHPRLQGIELEVHRFGTEAEMMHDYLYWWREMDFDVVVGYNSERFDVTYITNRCMRILGSKLTNLLSPYDIIQERTIQSKFGEYQTYEWVGINLLDYAQIYQKHSFTTLRSNTLDSVADFEIGTGKLEYTEAGSLNALWSGQFRTNWDVAAHSEMSFASKLRTAVGDKLQSLGRDVMFGRDDVLPPTEYTPTEYKVKEVNYDTVHRKFDKLEERSTGLRLEFVIRQRKKAIDREEYRYKMRKDIQARHNQNEQAKVETAAAIGEIFRECGDDVDLLQARYDAINQDVIEMCQQLYHEYNIVDVKVMMDIDIKRQLMPLTYMLAYTCFCNYQTTLATVKPWDALVYRYLVMEDRQPPIVQRDQTEKEKFPGAFVFEVQQGKHKWVWSADAASLYPITEISTNISAEVIVDEADLPQEVQEAIPMNYDHEKFIVSLINEEIDLSVLKKYNLSMSGFRQFFKKDEIGIFPKIKADLFARRKGFKGQMFVEQNKIQAIKAEAEKRGLTLHT